MVAGFRRVLGALLLCNGIESVEELLGNARQSGHETSDRRVHSAQHRRNENLAADVYKRQRPRYVKAI